MSEALFTSNDCRACRRCCTFYEDEVHYAPLFTAAEKARAEAEFPEKSLRFDTVGQLWRIQLQSVTDGAWQCPLYAAASARCLIQPYKPSLCRSWPFYLARNAAAQVVLAYYPACPPLANVTHTALQEFASRQLVEQLLAEARQYPELISAMGAADQELFVIAEETL